MNRTRRLIVNADDYHTDRARSRGICEAARRGMVTSATVLTNLPGLGDALPALEEVLGPGIGVHLNLTKGAPLCQQAETLTDRRGRFLPKAAAWRRALRRGFDPAEIEREWAAQIEAFLRTGRQPDHLDGNNHLHVFPGCAGVAARLAKRYAIRRIRLPHEPLLFSGITRTAGIKRLFISLLARSARPLFLASGLTFPDRMAGIASPDTSSPASLCRFLQNLPAGVTELMCHPGYRIDGSASFSGAARERELAALASPAVLSAVSACGIELISFSDLK